MAKMQETKLQVENRGQVRVETVHGQKNRKQLRVASNYGIAKVFDKASARKKELADGKRSETSNGLAF